MKYLKLYSLMFATLLISNSVVIMPMQMNQHAVDPEEEPCSVCFGEPGDEGYLGLRRLGCGHEFCAGCLQDQLRLGLDEEWAQAFAQHTKCLEANCPYQMTADDILVVTGDQARVHRFNQVLTDLFINANRQMRHCPTARCEVI